MILLTTKTANYKHGWEQWPETISKFRSLFRTRRRLFRTQTANRPACFREVGRRPRTDNGVYGNRYARRRSRRSRRRAETVVRCEGPNQFVKVRVHSMDVRTPRKDFRPSFGLRLIKDQRSTSYMPLRRLASFIASSIIFVNPSIPYQVVFALTHHVSLLLFNSLLDTFIDLLLSPSKHT